MAHQKNFLLFDSLLKIGLTFRQNLPPILISSVIGLLFATIIGISVFDIFSYGLCKQLFLFFLFSCGCGILCYLLLAQSPFHSKILLSPSETGFDVILRKTFLAVFILFPITLILSQQVVEFLQILGTGQPSDFIGWLPPGTVSRAFFIWIFALSCIFLLAVFLAGRRRSVLQFFSNLPRVWYVLFILIFSVVVRLPVIYSINTQPVSDFEIINEDALALAQGQRPTHMYVATHVAVTMVYGFVYQVFGSDLTTLKIFHAVVYGIAGIFLYGAGTLIFESKLWAGMAALLLVGLPSLAVYSNVLTPEHLFILIECALVFTTTYFFKNLAPLEQNTGGHVMRLFLAGSVIIGLLIGLMGMFRPFSELFLIAFVVTSFLYIKNLKKIAVSLVGVLIAFWLLKDIPTVIATHYQNRFASIRPCNLLVGMNFEAIGQYNVEDVKLCSKLRSEISDETVFTQTVMGVVWTRIREQQNKLLPFVNEKFAILWTNSNGILFWTVRQVNGGDQNSILETVQKTNLVDFTIMFLLSITSVVGTVKAFFRDMKPVLFFCLLVFFGFNLMEIPFELQTRYRTVVMPILIFFGCWTLSALPASAKSNHSRINTEHNSGLEESLQRAN